MDKSKKCPGTTESNVTLLQQAEDQAEPDPQLERLGLFESLFPRFRKLELKHKLILLSLTNGLEIIHQPQTDPATDQIAPPERIVIPIKRKPDKPKKNDFVNARNLIRMPENVSTPAPKPSVTCTKPNPKTNDSELESLDPELLKKIQSEIVSECPSITWDDISGLTFAKRSCREAVVWPTLRPDLFGGLRKPPKGILLFGPPGTGKTLLGKCIASECKATFINISASSLLSKWIGESEKLVRAMFAVARSRQPTVIFIDEIDSLLSQRSSTEHESSRRMKTEFLVQLDGCTTREDDRVLVVAATNRPQELDEAARRRFAKKLYIPLPDKNDRICIVQNLVSNENHILAYQDYEEIAEATEGYSGADMKILCVEAAFEPLRGLTNIQTVSQSEVRPMNISDFRMALKQVKASVSQEDMEQCIKWNNTFGSSR